jgi:hypothetical protein
MSAEKPTEKQILALNKLHSKNFGFMTNLITGERVDNTLVTFCDHCKTDWPCKTMQTLGVKK